MTKYQCEACKIELECAGEGEINFETNVPHRWHVRVIDDRRYILCDVCGNIRQFKGGVSAYLCDCLSLGPDARCDVSAEVEQMASRRYKSPRRRRAKSGGRDQAIQD